MDNNNGVIEEVIPEKMETPTDRLLRQISKDAEEGGVTTTPVEPSNGEPEPTPTEKPKPVEDDKYDYSFIKDLTPEQIEEAKGMELNEDFRFKYIETFNDMKKHNNAAQERLNKIKELEKQMEGMSDEKVKKYEDFVKGLREDTRGAWNRFQAELELPDATYLEQQFSSGGDLETRLVQFQETQLVPSIEKKFKIESGTFVYDPAEAYKAGTPSYEYRISTENKEGEFKGEYSQKTAEVQKNTKLALEQREIDMGELKTTYFPAIEVKDGMSAEDLEKTKAYNEQADKEFVGLLGGFDEMFTKIKEGKLSMEDNPLSFKNIFRGVHFDYLVDKIRKDTVANLTRQYNEKGMFLRDEENKPLPTNVTKVAGGVSGAEIPGYLDEEQRRNSPLKRSLYRAIK